MSNKLKFIEVNRIKGSQHYVKVSQSGTISITNENFHTNYKWEDKNIRLLALFKYWNIIEYFFPYKYQIDVNWDDILKMMIPKFLNSQSLTFI